MKKLSIHDLYTLEQYHNVRGEFRQRVLEHKKRRQVPVGPIATLYFEDRLTIQYQIQEMLRIERIFEREAIEEELESYNPLIPDGANLKATFMIEVPDAEERRRVLGRLAGIEHRLYVRIDDLNPVFATADEDLERTNEEKTSAVHFVRFELGSALSTPLKNGAELSCGIDHPEYRHEITLTDTQRHALLPDLD
ncbi:MAG TPA: DUF3501 family protein [Gammaproteobacteria bacterium]